MDSEIRALCGERRSGVGQRTESRPADIIPPRGWHVGTGLCVSAQHAVLFNLPKRPM